MALHQSMPFLLLLTLFLATPFSPSDGAEWGTKPWLGSPASDAHSRLPMPRFPHLGTGGCIGRKAVGHIGVPAPVTCSPTGLRPVVSLSGPQFPHIKVSLPVSISPVKTQKGCRADILSAQPQSYFVASKYFIKCQQRAQRTRQAQTQPSHTPVEVTHEETTYTSRVRAVGKNKGDRIAVRCFGEV